MIKKIKVKSDTRLELSKFAIYKKKRTMIKTKPDDYSKIFVVSR